ncbi:MAG: GMC family oxidoreductase [Verrucomicrobia bacterium]|nr:GMC family oxidoreductase [Verrucomicrobiota bacterium]
MNTLRALAQRLIPADDFPDGWSPQMLAYFQHITTTDLAGERDMLLQGLADLDREAIAQHGQGFAGLESDLQDALLKAVEAGTTQHPWSCPAARWFRTLTALVAENYYADPAAGAHGPQAGWTMLGYNPAPRDPFEAAAPPNLATTAFDDIENQYDAIIIGAGAGGGTTACVLAEAGKRVLLIEGGPLYDVGTLSTDHLRNHRMSRYGHSTGPEVVGNPRVVTDRLGRRREVGPLDGAWQNNAMNVGGGTRVYGAQAWRFLPEDFRMATEYGVPEGSSLADWPLTYTDLAPYYERAERELGVSGQRDGNVHAAPRATDFPMPPLPDSAEAETLRQGAEHLGISTGAVPLLINSMRYNQRAACVGCGACVGFECPSNSKTGSHNSVIPRALATGRCDLVVNTRAARILIDADGRATGVVLKTRNDNRQLRERTIRAPIVVSSAGAIESARLLLNSATAQFPDGLGNGHDHVGRHLQGHVYSGCQALLPNAVVGYRGPGVRIATTAWNHGNPGIIGGGMLANEFVLLPVIAWHWHLPPDRPRWGHANKSFMRYDLSRMIQIKGPTHEIPNPNSRVTVDKRVTDDLGIPVACLSGQVHAESLRTGQFMAERAADWARACGAVDVWTSAPTEPYLSAGQHQAGTCRMGHDPKNSVCDPFGQVHGHPGLYVIDGSLHVTNGGFNPVLTIFALAYRCAASIL